MSHYAIQTLLEIFYGNYSNAALFRHKILGKNARKDNITRKFPHSISLPVHSTSQHIFRSLR